MNERLCSLGVHATWNSGGAGSSGLLSLAVMAAVAIPTAPPGPPNECQPSKGCSVNVCGTCCQDYIPDGEPCDKCVKERCNGPKPGGPSQIVANLSASSCGGGDGALWQLPLPPINGTGGGVTHTATAHDSPWTRITVVSAADDSGSGGSIALVGGYIGPSCPGRGHPTTMPAFAGFAAVRLPSSDLN